jgi:hypothetical protein
MRLIVAVIVTMTWPAFAAAQSSTLAPLPPLPPIGLPLPEITAPLTPIGLPPVSTGFPLFIDSHSRRGDRQPRGPQFRGPRFDSRRGIHPQSSVVFFLHSYDWGIPMSARSSAPGVIAPEPSLAPPREERGMGSLRLELQPSGVVQQLYVDGFFVGAPDDVDGEITLPAGAHNIEVRASGYATLGFAVQIPAGRSITYRGALQRVEATPVPDPPATPSVDPPPAEPAATPSTFYFIPGCYIGNVPPDAVVLPANCDRTRLITRTP